MIRTIQFASKRTAVWELPTLAPDGDTEGGPGGFGSVINLILGAGQQEVLSSATAG